MFIFTLSPCDRKALASFNCSVRMLTSVGVLHPWRSTSGRFPPSSFGPGPAGHWGCPGAPSPPAMTPHAEVFQPQTSRPPPAPFPQGRGGGTLLGSWPWRSGCVLGHCALRHGRGSARAALIPAAVLMAQPD